MAVTVQNTTHNDGSTDATSFTFAHDSSGGGSNLAIGVGTSSWIGAASVTGVTYDGDSLTQRATATDGESESKIWTRPNISTGASLNVVVTLSSSAQCHSNVITVQNVDQTTEFSNITQNTGTSNPSISVTSVSGEMVFDTVANYNSASISVGNGQTEIGQTQSLDIDGFGSYEASTGSSVTMSWQLNGGRDHAHCGLSFQEVSAVAIPTRMLLTGVGV